MSIKRYIFHFLILISFSISANGQGKSCKIGFSQCTSDDLWRQSMEKEMNIELSLYPELTLIKTNAHGNSQKQIKDVQFLLRQNIDLLIITPNEAEPLTDIVEYTFDLGIPVIVVDRIVNTEKYTAYIGADNYEIGMQAGLFAVAKLNEIGSIIEITGLPGSSPAKERHEGFMSVIANFPEIIMLKTVEGDWQQSTGEQLMETLLRDSVKPDLFYFHNDFMAIGGVTALEKLKQQKNFFIVSIDGLATEGLGIDYVKHGKIDATFIYPTGGGNAIEVARKILNGLPYKRTTTLSTFLINNMNANFYQSQMREMHSIQDKIEQQKVMVGNYKRQVKFFQTIAIVIGISLIIVFILSFLLIRSNRNKQNVLSDLNKKNDQIRENNQKLHDQKVLLEKANATKNKFFTILAHDLKGPFNAILGFSNLLVRNYKDYDEKHRKDMISFIAKGTSNLYNLTENLLEWSHSQTGGMNFQPEEFKFNELVDEVFMVMESVAKAKEINLVSNVANEFLIKADKNMIKTVMRNLISNAVKFTSFKGTVQINAEQESTHFQVQVIDNGIGIKPDVLEKLFNFMDIKSTPGTNDEMGSGIGLSLCKEFIEKHQGSIRVESKEGEGSNFSFIIPQ